MPKSVAQFYSLILILTAASLVGCGVNDAVDATKSMPDKMDTMTEKMNETNEAVRLQKVVLAKQGMEDPDNAKVIMPIPFGIMPYAEKFAENATEAEVLAQIYLYLKEINDGLYSPKVDETGNEVEFTAEEINQINFEKLHRFAIAQAVSGFLSQEMVASIVTNQIYSDGRFQKTAFEILMMRFQFLRDVLLTNSLLSTTAESAGIITDSVKYLSQMNWVAKRPFIDHVQVRITGFLPPFEDFFESLTKDQARDSLLDLIQRIENQSEHVQAVISENDSSSDSQKVAAQKSIKSKMATALSELAQIKAQWQ